MPMHPPHRPPPCAQRDVQLLIRGRPRHRAATTLLPYLQYVAHLAAQLPPVTPDEAFERPYFDYLQARFVRTERCACAR